MVAEVDGEPGGSARLDAGEPKLEPPHRLGGSARLDAGEPKLEPPHRPGGSARLDAGEPKLEPPHRPGGSARLDAGEPKLEPPHRPGGSARLDAGEPKLEPPHRLGGFVTGYRRPERPATLMVWQVAVNAAHRGAGLAGRMLDHLVRAQVIDGVTHLETSITPDNEASRRLFGAFARRWEASLECSELFGAGLFPESHLAEELFRIGPLRVPARRH
nr:diaminobutyrate acetyltransferase [Mycolicibacter minnesotensis]